MKHQWKDPQTQIEFAIDDEGDCVFRERNPKPSFDPLAARRGPSMKTIEQKASACLRYAAYLANQITHLTR